jgi:hypothetical protein
VDLDELGRRTVRFVFPDAGNYQEDVAVAPASLQFRAIYKFHALIDDTSGIAVTADGVASMDYVERPNNVEEDRTRWTRLTGALLEYDSTTGRFCYRATMNGIHFSAGSCS